MNSEEIIERLLEEKHITTKEAMILIKDLNKNSCNDNFIRTNFGDFPIKTYPWAPSYPYYPLNEPVMYHTTTRPNTEVISQVGNESFKIEYNITKN